MFKKLYLECEYGKGDDENDELRMKVKTINKETVKMSCLTVTVVVIRMTNNYVQNIIAETSCWNMGGFFISLFLKHILISFMCFYLKQDVYLL